MGKGTNVSTRLTLLFVAEFCQQSFTLRGEGVLDLNCTLISVILGFASAIAIGLTKLAYESFPFISAALVALISIHVAYEIWHNLAAPAPIVLAAFIACGYAILFAAVIRRFIQLGPGTDGLSGYGGRRDADPQ